MWVYTRIILYVCLHYRCTLSLSPSLLRRVHIPWIKRKKKNITYSKEYEDWKSRLHRALFVPAIDRETTWNICTQHHLSRPTSTLILQCCYRGQWRHQETNISVFHFPHCHFFFYTIFRVPYWSPPEFQRHFLKAWNKRK